MFRLLELADAEQFLFQPSLVFGVEKLRLFKIGQRALDES
jgi:hypothetical protein